MKNQLVDPLFTERSTLEFLNKLLTHLFTAELPKAVHHAVISYLGGVRNKTENGLVKVVLDAIKDLGNEIGSKFHSLVVDLRIVTTREVDALKRTGALLFLFGVGLNTQFTSLIYNPHIAARQLFNGAGVCIEDSHQRHPLTGKGDDFIVFVVMARPNSIGVSQHKPHTVSGRTCDGKSTVPLIGAFVKNT